MSPQRLPAATPAQVRLVTTVHSWMVAAVTEVQVWRMKRQLLSVNPGLFKDAACRRARSTGSCEMEETRSAELAGAHARTGTPLMSGGDELIQSPRRRGREARAGSSGRALARF